MKRKVLVYALIIISTISFAQVEMHKEVPDDPYIPVALKSMKRSPAYTFKSSHIFTTQVNIDQNGNNIIGDAANEPSIAVDPTNPDRMVIGWRHFNTITSNFRQAGYGYSTDGGVTWVFPGVLEPGIFHSDPVLDFDAAGNFYYNSLTNGFACEVFKITDGGVVWENAVPALGGDKQWMRIDRTNGIGSGHNYSSWSLSLSTCLPGNFTRSTNEANSFENCVPILNNPKWGTLAVDADGILYSVGKTDTGSILVKSTRARNPALPVTWDSSTVLNLGGIITARIPVNPDGLLGQLWVDVDISEGVGHGNVYVLASVVNTLNNDPGDVMFIKSTDGGATFSVPLRINKDVGTASYQWFGTMSVAPNGRIDVVWLDTRDAVAGTLMSSLYYTFSEDQGTTWSAEEVISVPFDPNIGYPNQDKMGDYFDMVSDNNGAHLAWTNTISGGQDVYYTHITPETALGIDVFNLQAIHLISYPNPFSEFLKIEFTIPTLQKVTVDIFDLYGRKMISLFTKEVSGKQQLIWKGTNGAGQKLNSGLYFMVLHTATTKTIQKIILE